MSKSYEMDMTRGAILPKIIIFSLPLMAASILQLLFNAADVIVVGRFVGPQAMAAVGSTTALINLIINFFVGLSVGVNVCAARFFAADRQKDLTDTIRTAILTAVFSGILLLVVGITLAKPMLELMGSPEDVIYDSVTYLRIYFLGMPALMIYDFSSAILRAVGDTKRPLYFQVAAGIINVILNLFFVLGLKIGVAGVGIATSISQTVSALLVLSVLVRDKGKLHLDLRTLRIDRQKLAAIFRVGLPAGLQSTVFSLSNVVIQSSINSFGSTAMAGSTASQNLEGFVYMAMNAIYQTNLSFTSQNIGAGRYSRINKILLNCLGCVVFIGILLGGLANLFSGTLLSFYTTDPEVLRYGQERLLIVAGPYFLCGIMDTMVGSLRGMDFSFVPMIVSFIGACGLRIIFIMTLFRLPAFHSLQNLYMSYPVSWTITFTAHIITFLLIRKRFPREDAAKCV